jgi:hypothetical protein
MTHEVPAVDFPQTKMGTQVLKHDANLRKYNKNCFLILTDSFELDRQTDRKTDRQTDRQTGRQIDR